MNISDERVLEIAKDVGAVAYSPPLTRDVIGCSLTFSQLSAFAQAITKEEKLQSGEAVAWQFKLKGDDNYWLSHGKPLDEDAIEITPLFTTPQVPEGWKPSEKELLEFAESEELFLFAGKDDFLAIANGLLEFISSRISAAPTKE